jgi:predicted Zn-dependent protease
MGFTAAGRLSMLLRLEGPTAQPPFTVQYTLAADRMRWQKAVAAATAAVNSAAVLRSAAITIETALEDDPDNAFLVQQAAALNSQLKATQHALELNERLPKLRPPCADDLTQRAFLLLSAGRLSEAEAPLLTAAQLEPGNTETYALLAQLWLMNQQFGRAQTFFGALVAKMPEHGGLRLVYADVLAANGEWTAAEAQWNAVLVRTPANEAALKPLVQRLLARKANDTAQDLMLKAFAANPRSFANNERLLQLYGERGDRAKVVELMRALADSGPVSPVLHADLGQLLVEFGQKHEARLEFIRARRLAETLKDTDVAKRADAAIRDYPLENQ